MNKQDKEGCGDSPLEVIVVAKASKELENAVANELEIPDPEEDDIKVTVADEENQCTKLKD